MLRVSSSFLVALVALVYFEPLSFYIGVSPEVDPKDEFSK